MRLYLTTRHRALLIATGDEARADTETEEHVGSPAADLTVSTSDAADEWTTYEDRASFGFGRPS